MAESINPVAVADETGVVYRESGETPVYVLLQVKKDASSNDFLDIDISTAGLDKNQTVAVLKEILDTLQKDDSNVLPDIDSDILPL